MHKIRCMDIRSTLTNSMVHSPLATVSGCKCRWKQLLTRRSFKTTLFFKKCVCLKRQQTTPDKWQHEQQIRYAVKVRLKHFSVRHGIHSFLTGLARCRLALELSSCETHSWNWKIHVYLVHHFIPFIPIHLGSSKSLAFQSQALLPPVPWQCSISTSIVCS